jgi:hypothetical protein
MKSRSIATALAMLLASSALAGPLEDGQAAYDKQDYKTAAQNFMVAASQGDDTARAHIGTMFV